MRVVCLILSDSVRASDKKILTKMQRQATRLTNIFVAKLLLLSQL